MYYNLKEKTKKYNYNKNIDPKKTKTNRSTLKLINAYVDAIFSAIC